MSLQAKPQPDFSDRIDSWIQDVIKSDYRFKLRSATLRPALAEASKNPRLRKRKPTRAPAKSQAKKKRSKEIELRGRTINSTHADKEKEGSSDVHKEIGPSVENRGPLQPCSSIPILTPSQRSSNSGTLSRGKSSKSKSPSKKGVKNVGQAVSNAGIDLPFLGQCTPNLVPATFEDLEAENKIPEKVKSLYWKLQIPFGVIPRELKESYDAEANTPQKRSAPPNDRYVHSGPTPYPKGQHVRLKNFVKAVFDKAAHAHITKAHESQWRLIAVQILSEIEFWQHTAKWRLLDVEHYSIEPLEIRPLMPNRVDHVDSGALDVVATMGKESNQTVKEEPAESMAKMVDLSLGLLLTKEEINSVTHQWGRDCLQNEDSLNQSIKFIKTCPLLADIEIKKTNQNRDAGVQMSIWNASAMRKRQYHGWDLSMPMPAIEVNGHIWTLYLYYAWGEDLIMMGPTSFGSTDSVYGVWALLYKLQTLISWGTDDFAKWVRAEMLPHLVPTAACRERFGVMSKKRS